jgi:hypothetical protein
MQSANFLDEIFSNVYYTEIIMEAQHNIDGLDIYIYVGEKARYGNILACSI